MDSIGGPNGTLTTWERIGVMSGTISPDRLTAEARAGYFNTVGAGGDPFRDEGLVDPYDVQDNPVITGSAAEAAERMYADALDIQRGVLGAGHAAITGTAQEQ